MELQEFEEIFKEECKNNNIKEPNNIEKYYDYMKLLLEWNEKINVTAIRDEKMFLVKHFIDSLAITRFVGNNKRIIDVGTGGGIPGIPLKLYNDSLDITLIDSVNKKVNIVKDVIEKLKLKNAEAIHIRAEDLVKNPDYSEKFDIAVSRAVSNMSNLAKYMIPFLKKGGIAICMKGPNYEEELEAGSQTIKELGGKVESIEKISIDNELERNIIIIKKC